MAAMPQRDADNGLKKARLAIHDAATALMGDPAVHPGVIGAALADELAWIVAYFVKEGKGPHQIEALCQQIRDQYPRYATDPNLLRPDLWGSSLPT